MWLYQGEAERERERGLKTSRLSERERDKDRGIEKGTDKQRIRLQKKKKKGGGGGGKKNTGTTECNAAHYRPCL